MEVEVNSAVYTVDVDTVVNFISRMGDTFSQVNFSFPLVQY